MARPKPDARNSLVYLAVLLVFSVGILVSFDIVFNSYRQNQSDQRFCALFIGLDDNNRAIPADRMPERTRKFAGIVRDLREDLNCPDTPQPSPVPTQATPTPTPTG